MFYKEWNCLHYGYITTLHVCTGTVIVFLTVILQKLYFWTGIGFVCNTATLQCFMFVQGLSLSAVQYRDCNCIQNGNFGNLQVFTGRGSVCSMEILQSYIFVQGMEMTALW